MIIVDKYECRKNYTKTKLQEGHLCAQGKIQLNKNSEFPDACPGDR